MFLTVFEELSDPSAPHFDFCLGLLRTVAEIKCCLLLLDAAPEALLCDYFTTLLDIIK
jgi:hypothetical protein